MGMDGVLDANQRLAINPGAGVNPALEAYGQTQNAAYLPQKLYMDALMAKVNLAKQTNPINMALIQHMLGGQPQAPQTTPGGNIGPAQMMGPGGAPPQISPQSMTASLGPSQVDPNERAKALIAQSLSQPQQPQAPQSPQVPQQIITPQAIMQIASGNQTPLPATSTPQDMAERIDLSQIPSQGTEDIMKTMGTYMGLMNRGVGAENVRAGNAIELADKNNATKETIADKNNETKEDIADKKHKGGTGPANDLKNQSEIAKIVNDNYGQYQKNPWMLHDPRQVESLVNQIDSEPNAAVQAAAKARFSGTYNSFKKNHPVSPVNPTGNPTVTSPKPAGDVGNVDPDSLLQNHWATPFGTDNNTGQQIFMVPKDKLDAAVNIYKKQGAPQGKIDALLKKYRAGPSAQPGG
jgi:hypothetical protein